MRSAPVATIGPDNAYTFATHMVPAALTLVSDNDTIVLRPVTPSAGDPIHCKQWDLGAPAIREVVADRTNADGTIDSTGYTGARSVAIDLVITGDRDGSPYAYAERLAAMTHPYLRPKLRITRATPEARGQTWEMALRGNPYTLTYGRRAASMLEMQLSFVAPLGYLEGDFQGYESAAADPTTWTYITWPLSFPVSTGAGGLANPALTLHVGGSAPIAPLVYIYGPVTNPVVSTDAGETFGMDGLTLGAGQMLEIDMGQGTVLLNGSADASQFAAVDWSVSSFWRWFPGTHIVRYMSPTGRFAVYWRDRRYSI